MKPPVTMVVVFACGYFLAWLIHHGDTRSESVALPVEQGDLSSAPRALNVDVTALRADYERQIADLKHQLELVRKEPVLGGNAQVALTTAERLVAMRKLRESSIESAVDKETAQLLKAGFTKARIDWIRKRSEELATEFRRKGDLMRQQGTMDMDAELAFSDDNDILLRSELGDEEYARYRQALERPIGVLVGRPLPGGVGEAAGIKAGDQIISYNGVRIFNRGELIPLQRKTQTSATNVDLLVLRDGHEIRLSTAGGDMRLQVERGVMPTRALGDLMNRIDRSMTDRYQTGDSQSNR
jgi:hypothetical protein